MESLEIRSFRAVFELERRLYRIDTIRLNPSGVPMRGLIYGACLLAMLALAARLPPTRWMLAPLPWYLVYLGIPWGLAGVLTLVRIEGRPFHVAVRALAAHRFGSHYLSALAPAGPLGKRWQPPPVIFVPDGSDGSLRRLRYTGPGGVLIACTHERADFTRRRRLLVRLREVPGERTRALRRAVLLELESGSVLRIHRRRGD
ncbi:MAG: hypothetical protein NVSMB51_03520 [Solirubrobacteraceae bacterium]